jgi:hypothetical protein
MSEKQVPFACTLWMAAANLKANIYRDNHAGPPEGAIRCAECGGTDEHPLHVGCSGVLHETPVDTPAPIR